MKNSTKVKIIRIISKILNYEETKRLPFIIEKKREIIHLKCIPTAEEYIEAQIVAVNALSEDLLKHGLLTHTTFSQRDEIMRGVRTYHLFEIDILKPENNE